MSNSGKDKEKDSKSSQEGSGSGNDSNDQQAAPKPTFESVAAQMLSTMDKYMQSKDAPLINKALRQLSQLRSMGSCAQLVKLWKHAFGNISKDLEEVLTVDQPSSNDAMEVEGSDGEGTTAPEPLSVRFKTEASHMLRLLGVMLLLDAKQSKSAQQLASSLVGKLESLDSRILGSLRAKALYFLSLSAEKQGVASTYRPLFIRLYRTATLRKDWVVQATCLNLVLRDLVLNRRFDQADALIRRANFPETHAPNNEHARFLFYVGTVKAVQLEYSDASRDLQYALRKAPQIRAKGFRASVMKRNTVVQLLMGEVPDRAVLAGEEYSAALAPYLELAQAVRVGDVPLFQAAVQKHAETFQKDGNFTLISRMRASVIKAGVRKISMGYSAIALADVASRLGLQDASDAEFIVAKAIHDGVIEGVIDSDNARLLSRESVDVYSTHEPQLQFSDRIKFCMELHDTAIKSLKFPADSDKQVEMAEEDVIDEDELNELVAEEEEFF